MTYQAILKDAKSSVGKGWWPIIEEYLPQIVELAPECNINVKEKFGLLRIQCYGETTDRAKIRELQEAAYIVSSAVCEKCGAPGKHRTDVYWLKTLCEPCYQKALQRDAEKE